VISSRVRLGRLTRHQPWWKYPKATPDPDGAGTAEVKITGTTVCWEIKATRVGTLMAAHIHKGRAGAAGPVVVPFGKTFKAKGCVKAPAAVAAGIKKDPSAYYVNVHNARYPAGALRGQLRSDD
jgi:hypothetical protein